jgi:hypothetical protein
MTSMLSQTRRSEKDENGRQTIVRAFATAVCSGGCIMRPDVGFDEPPNVPLKRPINLIQRQAKMPAFLVYPV